MRIFSRLDEFVPYLFSLQRSHHNTHARLTCINVRARIEPDKIRHTKSGAHRVHQSSSPDQCQRCSDHHSNVNSGSVIASPSKTGLAKWITAMTQGYCPSLHKPIKVPQSITSLWFLESYPSTWSRLSPKAQGEPLISTTPSSTPSSSARAIPLRSKWKGRTPATSGPNWYVG